MRDFTKPLPGWSVLSRGLLLAVCGLSVLSAASCRTSRSAEAVSSCSDSLSMVSTEYATLWKVTEAVGGDSVRLTVPMETLLNLPSGATFTRKSGRTRVSLKADGTRIVAEAETDSVGRTVIGYERKSRDSVEIRSGSTSYAERRIACGDRSHFRGLLLAVVVLAAVFLALRWRGP